jgi:hypothetical protein
MFIVVPLKTGTLPPNMAGAIERNDLAVEHIACSR